MFQKLKPHLYPLVWLLLLVAGIYGQTLGHDFLSNWDDDIYITKNAAINGISLENLKVAFSTTFAGNFAPVQIISYMLDHSLWGLRPSGFHFTNLLLHAVNGILLYLLVFRLSGRRAWAFWAAAVFVLHPVQVESVAWLSQRKNLLAMTFFLSAVISYHVYRQRPSGQAAPPYAMAAAFFCLALLTKSVVVILPVVLVLMDRCSETPPRQAGLWRDKLPFIVASGTTAVLTIFVQSPELGGGRTGYHGDSVLGTFFTMQTVLVKYVKMLFWPFDLNCMYLPPFKPVIDWEVALAMIFAAALVGAGVVLLRRNRRLFFGYAVFFVGLLPVSQIVPIVTFMNDRYLYFPLLGGGWLAGGALCLVLDKGSQWQRQLALGTCGILLGGLAFLSYQRTAVWKDSVTLWSDAVAKLPDSWEVRAAYADAQVNAGMSSEALQTYAMLFRMSSEPIDPLMERKALNNAAALHINNGSYDQAFPLLKRLVAKFPDYPVGYINLGNSHRMVHDLAGAEQAYRQALSLQPDNTLALTMLATVYLDQGKLDSARDFFNQALALGASSPDLYFYLACLEAKSQNGLMALRYLEEALQRGYSDYDMLTSTPALASVRQLAGYGQLIQNYFANRFR